MKSLLQLIQFMTRIPVPIKTEYDNKKIGKAMKFFPLVGALIGVILYGEYMLLERFFHTKVALAGILVLTEIILTGGLHLDGLSDTFDGIFSYRSKQRMLEIMKDSRVGANGALSLVILFILKTLFLAEVGFEFLLIMPVIGRMASVVNAGFAKYARPTGMGKGLVDETHTVDVVIATIITAIISYAVLEVTGLIIVGVIFVLALYFAKLMERKIGGVTGDTLGAVVELSEVIVLLAGIILI